MIMLHQLLLCLPTLLHRNGGSHEISYVDHAASKARGLPVDQFEWWIARLCAKHEIQDMGVRMHARHEGFSQLGENPGDLLTETVT